MGRSSIAPESSPYYFTKGERGFTQNGQNGEIFFFGELQETTQSAILSTDSDVFGGEGC